MDIPILFALQLWLIFMEDKLRIFYIETTLGALKLKN